MRRVTACPACRTAVPPGQHQCLRCGHAVAEPIRPCPACGRPAGAAARFCAHCGQPLDAPPGSEEPTVAAPTPVDTTGVFLAPRSHRRPVLVGVSVFGAVIVLLSVLYAVEWMFFGPQRTVSAYFDALAARDAVAAGRLLSNDGEGGFPDSAILDPAALKSDGYTPPTDVRIRTVETGDDTAVAEISFSLGGERQKLTLNLRRENEPAAGLFHRWRIVDGVYPISVRAPGLDAVVIAGVRVPYAEDADGLTVAAFPGAYSVALPEQPLFTASEATLYAGVLQEGSARTVEIVPTIKSTARSEVDRQVRAYVDTCARSAVLEPDNCPFSAFSFSGEVRNVRWQINRYPTIALTVDRFDSRRVHVRTTNSGRAEVVWQQVFSDGSTFDQNQDVVFSVSGVVMVSGDTLTFQTSA